MKTTVGQLRAALYGLPDDLPVQFDPITEAWLGTMKPMRAKEFCFYDGNGNLTQPDGEGAELHIYLYEDRR